MRLVLKVFMSNQMIFGRDLIHRTLNSHNHELHLHVLNQSEFMSRERAARLSRLERKYSKMSTVYFASGGMLKRAPFTCKYFKPNGKSSLDQFVCLSATTDDKHLKFKSESRALQTRTRSIVSRFKDLSFGKVSRRNAE